MSTLQLPRSFALTILCVVPIGSAAGQILMGPPTSVPVASAEWVDAGDIDGDGHLDLFAVPNFLVFTDNFSYSVSLGAGDGTFGAASVTSTQSNYWGRGELADLDGDGHLDYVVPADTDFQDGHLRVLLGAGDGTFPSVQILNPNALSVASSNCVVRDLDDDGDLDIIEATSELGGPTIWVHLGDATEFDGFADLPPMAVGSGGLVEFAPYVDVVDLDGDGFREIVATTTNINGPYAVAVLDATGPTTWAPQVMTPLAAQPTGMAVADLDGNGDLDLAIADDAGNLLVLLGAGDATFGAPIVTPVAPLRLNHVTTDDFDGDGTLDAVVTWSSEVVVLRGLGDGTFGPAVRVSQVPAADGVAVGDYDEDGALDLAVAGIAPCMDFDCDGQVLILANETYPAGSPFTDLGQSLAGANGYPIQIADGSLLPGRRFLFQAFNAPPLALGYFVLGVSELGAPFKGGVLVPSPDIVVPAGVDGAGLLAAGGTWPASIPSGASLWVQWWFQDAGGVFGKSATSGVRADVP